MIKCVTPIYTRELSDENEEIDIFVIRLKAPVSKSQAVRSWG